MERTPPKTLSTSDPNLNVTKRGNSKRVRLEDDTEFDKLEQLKEEIIEMFSAIIAPLSSRLQGVEKSLHDIIEQNTEIKSSNCEIEKSLTFLSGQIKDFEGKIVGLEKDCNTTKASIADLEERHELLDRTMRKTSAEIRGVPKRKKENKLDILNSIKNLMKTINLESATSDVIDVYRLPSKETSSTSTIIVEFSNIFIKENFLRSTKQYNKDNKSSRLNATHLFPEEPAVPIYFSEYLTNKAKRLHFLARDFAQTEKYKFCWITNGRIFLRKEEGANYIHVKNEDIFQQIREN